MSKVLDIKTVQETILGLLRATTVLQQARLTLEATSTTGMTRAELHNLHYKKEAISTIVELQKDLVEMYSEAELAQHNRDIEIVMPIAYSANDFRKWQGRRWLATCQRKIEKHVYDGAQRIRVVCFVTAFEHPAYKERTLLLGFKNRNDAIMAKLALPRMLPF